MSLHVIIKKVEINNDDLDYDIFKNKLYMIWLNKNIIMDKYKKVLN